MSIRPAVDSDQDALRRLWEAYHAELQPPAWWDESWAEAWEGLEGGIRSGLLLVAEADGEGLVGYAFGSMRRPKVGFLDDLYVDPSLRSRGIAKALLHDLSALMRGRGTQVLRLGVEVTNERARTVYRRLGFRDFSVGLVADIDALERRAATSETPPSYASTHVQTDDVEGVQRATDQYLPRLGGSGDAEVSASVNGWVTVVDELCDRDRSAQRRLGGELSERMGVPVVALAVEEDAVVRFLLFERGRMLDEYLSVPSYYGELSKADELALAANSTLVARLTGADPARVRAVARVAGSPGDLPPAGELATQIAATMGLEARLTR